MKKVLFTLLIGIALTACSDDDAPNTPDATISISDLTQLSVDENSINGTVIGNIVATVGNSNETPVYSIISQNPAGSISLNGNEIIVADSNILDHETNVQISGEIKGTVGSATTTANFIISIENVDEVINFPDSNFKSILVNNSAINTNNDNDILESEALNFSGHITAQNSSIQDATGIEYFTNVTRISFFGNNLTTIDVSKNTQVTQLLLENNNLTSIDISNLTVLTDFKCHSNNLTEANIANGNNANMVRMELQGNSSLNCIKVDEVTVPTTGWIKDANATYNTDCN